jgi:tetratricopeptide (TPR) repeat protein
MDLSSVTNKEFSTAKAIMTSQELSQFAQANDQRKRDGQKRLIDRIRQEQAERARIESLKNAHDSLSKVEQDKRKKQAEDFAESALDLYRGGQYAPAEENFRKSFELNPENKKYYFQYGMTLYKNQKYNDAIVAFNISQSNKDYELESIYYAGLAEYNLKEYEQAIGRFNDLEQKKDKEMSPLASFYAGIIYYDQKNYDKAKEKFQVVLDTSNDTKLDEKADKYIDDINQAITYAKNKQKTVFLSGTLGSMYDSNVLLQSDSSADQGTAQGKGSLRYLIGLGTYYRPVFNDKYEFGPKFRTDYIFTQNSALTDFDPWSVQITTPFSYKSTFKKKAMKLDIKPGFETLYLGQEDNSGKPKKTLQGTYLEVAPTFVMSDRWLSTYSLTYRKDKFVQATDQAENANKITFKFSNLLFVNKQKTKSVLMDLGYTNNSATGSDYNFKRYDFSALYILPVFKNAASFAGGVSLYKLNYPDKSTPQHDFNKTLTATLSKTLTENVSGTILGTYTLNGSNSETSDYNKWTLGILFNAEFGL